MRLHDLPLSARRPERATPVRSNVRAALTSSWWWAALLVLLANDHLFKQASWFPQSVAGKLSDVAGLLMFPALAAMLLRLESRHALQLLHVACAIIFTSFQLSPALTDAFVASMRPLGLNLAIWPDPTDLLALPVLGLSYFKLTQLSAPTLSWDFKYLARPLQKMTTAAACLLGLFATLASSEMEETEPYPDNSEEWQDSEVWTRVSGTIFLHNATTRDLGMSVYRPNPDRTYDCDLIAQAPGMLLGDDAFGPAEFWELPATTIGAIEENPENAGKCSFIKIVHAELPPTIAFWRDATLTRTTLPGSSIDPIEDNAVIAVTQPASDTLALSTSASESTLSTVTSLPSEVLETCLPPTAQESLAWDIPQGDWLVTAVAAGEDGCFGIDLQTAPVAGDETTTQVPSIERAYLCMPADLMPIVAQDIVTLSASLNNAGIELEIPARGQKVELYRSNVLPKLPGVALGALALDQCQFVAVDVCGGPRRLMAVNVSDALGNLSTLSVGGLDLAVNDADAASTISLRLLDAETLTYDDAACSAGGNPTLLRTYQFVITHRAQARN